MPIKLTTTPYLTNAFKNLKFFIVSMGICFGIAVCAVWPIRYYQDYMRNPTLYNPLATTLENMRITGRIVIPVTAICSIFLVIAGISAVRHFNACRKLANTKNSRYGTFTSTQTETISKLATITIANLLEIKSREIIDAIWSNIRYEVLQQLQKTDRHARVDLTSVIKHHIALAASNTHTYRKEDTTSCQSDTNTHTGSQQSL